MNLKFEKDLETKYGARPASRMANYHRPEISSTEEEKRSIWPSYLLVLFNGLKTTYILSIDDSSKWRVFYLVKDLKRIRGLKRKGCRTPSNHCFTQWGALQ